MDKWTDVQAKRMTLGGNKNCITYFRSHPDYRDKMTIPEKYDSEFASFYKDKLVCACESREFIQPEIGSRRKIVGQSSPKKSVETSSKNGNIYNLKDPNQKQKNEDYFSRMGEANKNRPDNLPPSKGGKYAGFGSGTYSY